MKTQTLKSRFGRDSLTVDAKTPTVAITDMLGWTHVATPAREVRRQIVEKIRAARLAGVEGYTRQIRSDSIAAAIWLHEENRCEYRWIAGGLK